MEKYSFIRHADKLKSGEERRPLELSGLSKEQKVKWADVCDRLKIEDPEITYESVYKIEELAKEIYEKLPEKALVVFTTTNYPRTKFTAEYLLDELENIISTKEDKKIYTEVIGESSIENKKRTVGVSDFSKEAPGVLEKMKIIAEENSIDDAEMWEYLSNVGGGKTHPKELELFFETVNQDLQSNDSIIKKRAEELKSQAEELKNMVQTNDLPVYFFGIGHMSGLISLDVAFNGREKYDNLDEMPKPLSLWEANKQK